MTFTKDQVINIAKKNGIKLKGNSLKFNESGLDFLVVLAEDINNENWVLRLTRSEDVATLTIKEKQTLDLIEPCISIEVPKWTVFTSELIT